ncbi:hypothetical protein [Pseudozobellia thermophila]|uniref:Uncharacterized protein n=1 Tax=Pseudozobellia thermophila TaxID=192903 RepID=A0A1M6FAG4_9FLAO|nr:hypothetical protein [Pseudozobellia thermophila]SHI94663.1 hypothetical protein SAMN04488513_102353 [Pseudozobellia thermophila]
MSTPGNYQEFQSTLGQGKPSSDWPEALKAMWYAANGNWEAAHDIAQEIYTDVGSWIHAHLHREEGDRFNAGYWYRKAGRPYCNATLEEERREITVFVLSL